MRSRTVFLAAGEQSGDLHGAELARELHRRLPDVRLVGLGGSRMAEQGVELLANLDRLAILGFAEVVRHLPDLARLRHQVRRFLLEASVDLFVPIDYPGFNLPLARFARRRGIRVLYYIAPQVWAWHESRARRLGEDADLVCVVLPFEAELLSEWGVRTSFVGHPLLDRTEIAEPERGENGPVLGLFPGLRLQEVSRLVPPMLAASRILGRENPGLRVIMARARDLPAEAYHDIGDVELHDAEVVVRSADTAITKSGTITLQLALAGVPMVVGYRVNPLTYAAARRLIRVEHISLINLVAGASVVPELIQHRASPEALAAAARLLLDPDSPTRTAQITSFAEVRRRLGRPGAAARVAEECVKLLTVAP